MTLVTEYDNEWIIKVSNTSNLSVDTLASTKGAFIGNGKLGYISAFDKIGSSQSIITVDFDFNEYGLYTNNIVNNFDCTTIKLFDNKLIGSQVTTEFLEQSLNMFPGTITSKHVITNQANASVINVTADLYTVRHMPYCTVQTLQFTPEQTGQIPIFHEISCMDNLTNVEYNNNVIYNENISSDKGVYMLTGKAIMKDNGKKIAFASCYFFESPKFDPVGFNVYTQDAYRCFQKININDAQQGTTYKMHVISATMTEYDFRFPVEEVKRILVNVVSREDVATAVQLLRMQHVKDWTRMWQSNITIDGKTDISPSDETFLNSLKQVTRYSLYNLWSSVREGVRTELNPLSLSVIDTNGNVFWDGDLWLVPTLILFQPSIARSILESRHKILQKAIQLATSYGYKGSKYPYANDVVGYGNTVYWDVSGPMHIFNTALININTWNLYRVTQDREWLLNLGYAMLKSNADFFVSKITVDEDGSYNIRDVYALQDKASNNSSLTNYLAKYAIKVAIEASYELGFIAKDDWLRCYYNLDMRYFDDPFDVVKLDDTYTENDTTKILEQLIPLTAYYNELFLKQNYSRNKDTIKTNMEFYETKIDSAFETNPLNNMILAWLSGQLTNYDSTFPTKFEDALKKIVTENTRGVWGNLDMTNNGASFNDLSLSALLILLISTSVGTLKISGQVSETRFYSESMGLKCENVASMPKSWKRLKISGVGTNLGSYVVLNDVYYE
jgi:trehalose/maltose hydrolase-like predicted phosphorylase